MKKSTKTNKVSVKKAPLSRKEEVFALIDGKTGELLATRAQGSNVYVPALFKTIEAAKIDLYYSEIMNDVKGAKIVKADITITIKK